MRRLLPTFKHKARLLQTATLRDFSGGWNVDDDDLNLAPRFLTRAKNVWCSGDGWISVRYGYRLLADLGEGIVHLDFFNGSAIAVRNDGTVWRVNADGSTSQIWSNAIAAMLPDAPSGWGPTQFASSAKFNGQLIIANGSDKPLQVNDDFTVEYLFDPATGTNINVPICRYVIAVSRYLVMMGDPLNPNRVHISARDAANTWYGDPPPNDATFVDVGSILANGTTIRGGMAFRGNLLVFFAEGTVIGRLGIYAEDEHEPDFNDSIEGYGCLAHRAAIATGDDGFVADFTGIATVKRTILSDALKPEPLSTFITPEYTRAILPYTEIELEDRMFAVLDTKEGQYMLFTPGGHTFVYTYKTSTRHEAWSEYQGLPFTCGTRTLQGNVLFGDADGKVWLFGNRDVPIYTDNGLPIEFEWELPWIDMKARSESKTSKHISFDTRGAAEFTCDMYVDKIMSSPALSMQFSGGEQGMFGGGPQPYGGGRNASYEKLYAWPSKFNQMKLRFSGTANDKLRWGAVTLHYLRGGIRR